MYSHCTRIRRRPSISDSMKAARAWKSENARALSLLQHPAQRLVGQLVFLGALQEFQQLVLVRFGDAGGDAIGQAFERLMECGERGPERGLEVRDAARARPARASSS
jgi:hypothetical protein